MLTTKEISVSWNNNNKDHFEALGYVYTKMKNKVMVLVNHLKKSSNLEIQIKFDCCGKEQTRRFSVHYIVKKGDLNSPDICTGCLNSEKVKATIRKEEEEKIIRISNMLSKETTGFWCIRENRLRKLGEFIEKHGTLENILNDPIGKKIYHNIAKKKESLRECVIELGYDPDILKLHTKDLYNDFSLIEGKIRIFINENNRFPSKKEIVKKLGIDQRFIDKNGGIYELKRKLQYFSKNDLVDDRLFINLSMLEFVVAQYLIFHEIQYSRERKIPNQNNTNYRYDFYIPSCDTFIEVWGFRSKGQGWSNSYGEKRKKKELIYAKNNSHLISIEIDDININDFDYTITRLNNIFSNFIDSSLHVPHTIFKSDKIISKEVLVNIVLDHSDFTNKHFVKVSYLNEIGLGYIVRIIRKRYGTYKNFLDYILMSQIASSS